MKQGSRPSGSISSGRATAKAPLKTYGLTGGRTGPCGGGFRPLAGLRKNRPYGIELWGLGGHPDHGPAERYRLSGPQMPGSRFWRRISLRIRPRRTGAVAVYGYDSKPDGRRGTGSAEVRAV